MFAKQAFNYAWSVIEARCTDLVFCVGAEGFNVMARAMEKMLLLSVFAANSFEDPAIGIMIDWEEIGIEPPADGSPAAFVFDASGQYGYLSVNGVGVVIKIEDDGVTVDVLNPANGEVIRSAIALWEHLEGEGIDPLDTVQQLYEKIECEGCGLPTQVDDYGTCNACHLQSER